jgi:hypothetical protein
MLGVNKRNNEQNEGSTNAFPERSLDCNENIRDELVITVITITIK